MKRNKKKLERRIKRIGLFFEIKKSRGSSSKRAIIEISQALGVSIHTVTNDLAKYNKTIATTQIMSQKA